jgi:putative ABC transport system permease protein
MSVGTTEFFSKGKISFPVTRAAAFAFKSIRIRLGRMIIVLMGVASAIAFMTMLFSMATFTGSAAASPATAVQAAPVEPQIEDPALVMEKLGGETIDSSAVARAFRPWWLVIAIAISIAGITNAVLMSVTERIKEIGTLQCLGAMSYHIVEIFLFETAFIGFIGGIVGALAGIGLAIGNLLISGARDAGMQIPSIWAILGTFAAGVFFSIVICLVASVIPVVVAARIEPADAMRYEV